MSRCSLAALAAALATTVSSRCLPSEQRRESTATSTTRLLQKPPPANTNRRLCQRPTDDDCVSDRLPLILHHLFLFSKTRIPLLFFFHCTCKIVTCSPLDRTRHPVEPFWCLIPNRSRCGSAGITLPPALFRHHLCHPTKTNLITPGTLFVLGYTLFVLDECKLGFPLQRPTSSHPLGRHSKHRRCLATQGWWEERKEGMVEEAQGREGKGAAHLRQHELIPSLQHDACPCRLLTSPMLYATKLFTRTCSFHRHAHLQKQATSNNAQSPCAHHH